MRIEAGGLTRKATVSNPETVQMENSVRAIFAHTAKGGKTVTGWLESVFKEQD